MYVAPCPTPFMKALYNMLKFESTWQFTCAATATAIGGYTGSIVNSQTSTFSSAAGYAPFDRLITNLAAGN